MRACPLVFDMIEVAAEHVGTIVEAIPPNPVGYYIRRTLFVDASTWAVLATG